MTGGANVTRVTAKRSPQRTALNAALSSVARSLASPGGANVEYDRALVDLASAILGVSKAEAARTVLSPQSPLSSE